MNPAKRARASVAAPCKINPTLVVIERRADGFHELDLIYLALDLCDRVAVGANSSGAAALRVEGPLASPDIPADARNLARRGARAALELAREAGLATAGLDFDLLLEKHVPSQAGLGGGSSDAAAAALGVCEVSGLSADDPRLHGALAQLGSDCVFFLAARASGHARGRGRGELIEVLPTLRQPVWVALMAPALRAPTEAVYRALGELGDCAARRSRALEVGQAWSQATTLASLRAALVNDLESAALHAIPGLSRWRTLLDANACEHFQLAGSGSSFFGLYADEVEARSVLEVITRAATEAGLAHRGAWAVRPSGQGVRIEA